MLFGKYINKYYLKYLWCYIIGIGILIVVDILHPLEPEMLGDVVNLVTELSSKPGDNEIINQVTQIGIQIIVLGLIMFIGRIIWRYTLFYAATKIEADLRKVMYEKAERLSPTYYHHNSVGNILNWFTSDLEEILEFYKWGTVQLVDASFLGIFMFIKMIGVSLPLSLVAIVPIILIAIWSFFAEKLFSEKWNLRQKSADKIYDFAQESFTGIRVIKAFVKENQQIKAFSKIANENKNIDVSVTRFFIAFERIVDLFIYICFGGMMIYGGYLVFDSQLNTGELVTFIGYFDSLLWPVFALGSVISMHGKAKACLNRITAFLDAPEDITQPENAVVMNNVKGKIEIKNLTFAYSKRSGNILKNVSLTINPGENIGIVGRIGCGKTTITNLICRLFNPPKGTVFIDGVDVLDMDLKSLRDCISYVPQDNFLFSDTIEKNIGFGKKNSSLDDIQNSAMFSDVHKDIVGFDKQYETIVGERGTTLSGGQKQRISMARAYLKNAPIMVMDDSVSAVDVKTEESILKNIKENRKGKTTLIVASRVSTVSKLDKVIVLKEGNLEAFDTPKELLKISPTYAKMHLLQELEKEKEGGK